ncbi:hypothetical protein DPMN_109334, partial [Dreissena polymorpha]
IQLLTKFVFPGLKELGQQHESARRDRSESCPQKIFLKTPKNRHEECGFNTSSEEDGSSGGGSGFKVWPMKIMGYAQRAGETVLWFRAAQHERSGTNYFLMVSTPL